MAEELTLNTSDGERLQAELYLPESPTAAIVIAHPHPKMGGDMHTPVPAAFFRALDEVGAAGIRFNFRGAGRSTGTHDEGVAERFDVIAALDAVVAAAPDVPVILSGWSFGADVSLSVDDDRVAGWFLAAAPLRVVDPTTMPARLATAPKRFAVPEVDQFAPPDVVNERIDGWANTTTSIVAGADHFFGGNIGPVTALFTDFAAEVIAATERD